jgi:regulator of protease activity HflC (stomatin/prohibitin superfamily)
VEDVVRLRPDQVRTVEVGFRTVPGSTEVAPGYSWASLHGGDGMRRMENESLMLTGDNNLVEVMATVRYRVVSPRVYLFEVAEPDEVIRGAAEAVLRTQVAGRPLGRLLTVDRDDFRRETLARLEARLREFGPDTLGIRLDGVSLHDLHPPPDVVPAYDEVARALEDRAKQINDAKTYARGRKEEASAEATRTVLDARAWAGEKRALAQATHDNFLARSKARRELSLVQEWDLFTHALNDSLNGLSVTEAESRAEKRRADAVALHAAVSDFRLFWDTLAAALTGRELVLIDAEKVPGRRHLLLLDPDLLRVPAPVLSPGREPVPRSPAHEGP